MLLNWISGDRILILDNGVDVQGEPTMMIVVIINKMKPYGAGFARGFPFRVSLRRECQASLPAFGG